MPSIVTVNVSVLQAPTPSTLQQTGAFISQGGTTGTAGSLKLITQMSDLSAVLVPPAPVQTISWATGVATVQTTSAHNIPTGQTPQVTIQGAVPAGYNGTFTVTVTGANTFTYPLVANPGTATTMGTWVPGSATTLLAMATTFFAQGTAMSIYVLELGLGDPVHTIAAFQTWLTNNPQTVYSFLVPRNWDAQASFLTLLASYEAPTAMQYFWVTTTASTYTAYNSQMKCVIALVEAPGIAVTEFSLAAALYQSLTYNPSPTNRVAPFAFSFTYGTTAYPSLGNQALLTQLKAANVNVIGSGAEGGETQTMIYWGTTLDGRDFTYWFSVDYTQIQAKLVLTNEVINGSNNPVNPLYYDQFGINRLQARLAQMMTAEISFGLAVGSVLQTEMDGISFQTALNADAFTAQAVINAIPFVSYTTANPGDFKIGKYAGLSIIYIPARGFIQIVLNVVVSDFITF
jgi:hypothetical protein